MSKGGYFTLAEAARLAGISAKELAAVGTKLRDQVGTKGSKGQEIQAGTGTRDRRLYRDRPVGARS